MAFEKITENSLVNKGVTGLPDVRSYNDRNAGKI